MSWVNMHVEWEDLKERAIRVSEVLPDYAAEWDGAEKIVVNCQEFIELPRSGGREAA